MSETRKTLMFIAAAVIFTALAILSAPKRITPNAFLDQGELFFPDFVDPNVARTLEVIDYDEATGQAVPFKVTFSDGRWTIPSHNGYAADGEERLAKTAAGVIGIRKDDFRTDNTADHAACGVIDPLDTDIVGVKGRGQRVTMKGENDIVLADFIIGQTIPGREGFRLVRVPGRKRVYAVRMNIDISTKFNDWIESDLLGVKKESVTQATVRDYTINERTGQLNERDVIILDKQDDGGWNANKMSDGQEVNRTKMTQFLTALEELKIEDVRPKPQGLSTSLSRAVGNMEISRPDMLSLQQRGYYFTRDGRLVSNEGELQARTTDGVVYTLRFGEVVIGSGPTTLAGSDEGGSGENRYLFITTTFDSTLFPEPALPSDMGFLTKADSVLTESERQNKQLDQAHKKWETKQIERRKISDDLNARFAKWYYVISSESFDKLRLTRADLIKEKTSP